MRRSLIAAALLSTSLLTAGCTAVRNPATGETQYTSLSPQEESKMGREEHPKVMAEFGGAYTEHGIGDYVQKIGSRLQAVSELPAEKFTFTVLDSSVVNAFALPGGFVYISRGLLALADNEAELAGVLGHEIGHVTARHTAQRYDRAVAGQIGTTAASVLGGIFLGQAGAQLGQQIAGLGATAYVQGFSREQEYEADQLGVRYLVRGGYDPEGMATLLDALDAETKLQASLSGRKNDTPDWLASHPRAKDRVVRAAETAKQAAGGGAVRIDRNDYLQAIDGIVFGDSPDQGFVRGTTFIHPKLDFRFDTPPGYKLQNTSTAVQGQGPDGTIMVFDLGKGKTSDPARYLTEEWAAKQRLQQVQRKTFDGKQGATGVGKVTFRNKPATAYFGVVQRGASEFYRFVFVSSGNLSSRATEDYDYALRSVRGLTTAERADAKPLRIRIRTVAAGDTIDSLGAQMDIDHGRDWLVVLNDLDRRGLRAGDKIKLVKRD